MTGATYQGVIDKVQKCLTAWKSHALSIASRLTLLHSVIAIIPIYTMQTAQLSVSVCEKLDQRNKNFLSGHTAAQYKVHLVNWDTIRKLRGLVVWGSRNFF